MKNKESIIKKQINLFEIYYLQTGALFIVARLFFLFLLYSIKNKHSYQYN